MKIAKIRFYHSGNIGDYKLKLRYIRIQNKKIKDRIYFFLINKTDFIIRLVQLYKNLK